MLYSGVFPIMRVGNLTYSTFCSIEVGFIRIGKWELAEFRKAHLRCGILRRFEEVRCEPPWGVPVSRVGDGCKYSGSTL